MGVYKYVVSRNISQNSSDISDAAHVGSKSVGLIKTASSCLQTVIKLAQVQYFKLIGGRRLVLWHFEIDPTNPMVVSFESFHKMVSDKTSGTGNKHTFCNCHTRWPPLGICKSSV